MPVRNDCNDLNPAGTCVFLKTLMKTNEEQVFPYLRDLSVSMSSTLYCSMIDCRND